MRRVGHRPDRRSSIPTARSTSAASTATTKSRSTARPTICQLAKGDAQYSLVIAAGDYNADGVVDAGDYTVWRNQMGQDFWSSLLKGTKSTRSP